MRGFPTQVFSQVLLYADALGQLLLPALVQQELADVEHVPLGGALLFSGRLAGRRRSGRKPPRWRKTAEHKNGSG